MASLRGLGASIEDSGLDNAWVEVNLYGPTTMRQILDGNHMNRALTAHTITTSALFDLYLDAFLKTESEISNKTRKKLCTAASNLNTASQDLNNNELKASHEQLLLLMEAEGLDDKLQKFDDDMESSHTTFKFVRDYMKFVGWIWAFIRATRVGDWKLHLESLTALCKYFFAHDRINYARMVPLYLTQMKQLESTDPDIHAEFMAGNFCVNKNEELFCAIGPDHAIEHVNKIMKIQGGLKGLTQQPAAMARWFLIASELSHLSNEAETFAGIVSTKQTRHHDASLSVLQRYEQNVNKLRDILMVNDPFTVADDVLMNIITKAVMPDPVKMSSFSAILLGKRCLRNSFRKDWWTRK